MMSNVISISDGHLTVTRRFSLVKQYMLTPYEAHEFIRSCCSSFRFLCNVLMIILFFVILLSVLRFTAIGCPFSSFKLFFYRSTVINSKKKINKSHLTSIL